LSEIKDLRVVDFWGDRLKHAPAVNERRKKILDILTKAKIHNNNNELIFSIGINENRRNVCEAGYLILIGLSTSKNFSDATKQWRNCKKMVLNEQISHIEETKLFHSGRERDDKFVNATAYIQHIAKFFGDKIPIAGGENITVLPYDDVKSFHTEYIRSCKAALISPVFTAGKITFTKAFNSLKDIRLLGCKGKNFYLYIITYV